MNETTPLTSTPEPRKAPRSGSGNATSRAERDELPADVTQLRAELAMMRSLMAEQLDRQREADRQKQEMARFIAWAGKSTQEKTQMVADEKFCGLSGDLWEVQLQEQPAIRLRAHSDYEAIGRYNELCGILQTEHKHTAVRVGAAA